MLSLLIHESAKQTRELGSSDPLVRPITFYRDRGLQRFDFKFSAQTVDMPEERPRFAVDREGTIRYFRGGQDASVNTVEDRRDLNSKVARQRCGIGR